MKTKQVLLKYHKLIPFPWTPLKISKAGFVPKDLFIALGDELRQCDDINTPLGKKTIKAIEQL